MRTLFHRLGAGALLAGAAMLGGCLSADKPIAKRPASTQKPVVNAAGQPLAGQPTVGQPGLGAQPTNPTSNSFGQPTSNNTAQPNNNQSRTNNSVVAPADPNPRIGVIGGPINPGVNTAAGNSQPPYNGIQPTGGFGANPGTADLRPIGTNVNNSNAIKPVMAGGAAGMPPPDPPPVVMQGNDRDALNNSVRSGPPALK